MHGPIHIKKIRSSFIDRQHYDSKVNKWLRHSVTLKMYKIFSTSVHNIVSSTVSQCLPQNLFYPPPSRNCSSLTKIQNFSGYFTLFCPDFVPEVLELYNLEITCQNPSATGCSIALNLLLRTFLDFGLVPGDPKGRHADSRWT